MTKEPVKPIIALWGITDIAGVLGISYALSRTITRTPGFPRPLPLPGRARWTSIAVMDWLTRAQEHSEAPSPALPAKRPPGRPRKTPPAVNAPGGRA